MKGIIFGGGRYGYKGLPKMASTSIKHAIYEIEAKEEYVLEKNGIDIHRYMHKKHIGDLRNCENRFIVVRDPIKRLLSSYKNRVLYHNELSEPTVKEKFPNYYWDIPYFTPGLGQFIEHLEDYLKIEPILHHCRPIVDFLAGQDLGYFSSVYKFENLSDFQRDLSCLVEREIYFPHKQTGGRKYFLRDLSNSQMEKLIDYYKDDYKLLEGLYSVDEIWGEWRGENHDPAVSFGKLTKAKRHYSIMVNKLKNICG